MVNPVIGGAPAQRIDPIHFAPPAPRGLADIPTTLSRAPVSHFFQKIYSTIRAAFNVLMRLFSGCFIKRGSSDKISDELLRFDNLGVQGQVNGIYITTNETNLAQTRELLTQHPRPAGETIHIGCATWHNLDILSARKSTYGLFVDFNPKNGEFIRKTVELIIVSDTRDAFKKAMIEYLNSLTGSERALFFHPDQQGLPTERIEKELTREGSWLQSEESYLTVKALATHGRLISITEDIRHFENFLKLRIFLDRHHIAIDTLYLSNVSNFGSPKHVMLGDADCSRIRST